MERRDFRMPRSAPMLIRVRERDGHILRGEILHHRLREPVCFDGFEDMAAGIDRVGRQMGVPSGGDEDAEDTPLPRWEPQPWPLRDYPADRRKETYYLELLARQDRNLQGRIRGAASGSKPVYFRNKSELYTYFSSIWQSPVCR